MSEWLLLHVYALVDFLDFVAVLFQSGVFEYILFYGGLSPLGARGVWEFQRSPSRLLSRMVECIFIPEDKHVITILDNYGL